MLPEHASIPRRAGASHSILSRAMAERPAPDGHDLSFRFGVLIAGLRSPLAAGPGRP